ncbi:hypothetical protein NTGBS_650003 [Candidatus Nitrotoga sp. BS]|uniref:hypothetical protein n=1 Tax=Candidatus Nitrotoga sp. BS TaxID=2890408 RepID=UPI001EF2C17A|nr:hypothetical protein [Candidatus Nitrotoga sp. BS]CAH1206531.1 hypothetical protein NTGBS_650003 [Candidatus Nitrotoga sp. BS]
MASFDWKQVSEKNLDELYNSDVRGYKEWQQLIKMLPESSDAEQPDMLLEAFDKFLIQLEQIDPQPNYIPNVRFALARRRTDC